MPRHHRFDLPSPLRFLLLLLLATTVSPFTFVPTPLRQQQRSPISRPLHAASVDTVTPKPPTPPPAAEPTLESLIPGPLNPLQRVKRAATFWSQIVPILGNYALIQRKLAAAKEKGEPVSQEDETKLWEDAHTWGAERLASTIQNLKGFYVKVRSTAFYVFDFNTNKMMPSRVSICFLS